MNFKTIKRATDKKHRALWNYRKLWHESTINSRTVLIESQQGRSLDGNMYYVARELANNPLYNDYELFFVVLEQNADRFATELKRRGLTRLKVTVRDSAGYVSLLATAKFLITDTGFPTYYMKKPGQVLWNTWHGTPLKAMGRKDASAPQSLGNMQRNFALADFLSYPNRYTADHMIEDYMLQNICKATLLFAEYPRNESLAKEPDPSFRGRYAADNQRIYAYMPTWRSYPGVAARLTASQLAGNLAQIDQRLTGDEVMYASVHPLQRGSVSFSSLQHVRPFPNDCETYEFLGICDALVTDYSSVMFDFAVTGRKTILFDYDADLYLATRGVYLKPSELPFPHVQTVRDLIEELRKPKDYDDAAFQSRFCPYPAQGATEKLCARVLLGKEIDFEEESLTANGKENVLIYAGSLSRNGITTSLSNLIAEIDLGKRNYFLTFDARRIKNKDFLNGLPDSISYIPSAGKSNLTPFEKVVQYLYGIKRIGFDTFDKHLRNAYIEDLSGQYGFLDLSVAVQFTGYDYKRLYQFSLFSCKKMLFLHNNMAEEAALKGNTRLDLLEYSLRKYDQVAVVTDDLVEPTKQINPTCKSIAVAPNLFDWQRVKLLGSLPIEFEETTSSTLPLNELQLLLDSNKTVIAAIGRYAPEKQHMLLLEAFNDVWKEREDVALVIIGGYSLNGLYKKTRDLAQSLPCSQDVVLIENMSNPYSILARSDGLILTSKYEGFGLVLLEADALGKPIVSTDVCGPAGFMREHGGTLVENSREGIAEGLRLLAGHEVKPLNVDYAAYNAEALKAFDGLFD